MACRIPRAWDRRGWSPVCGLFSPRTPDAGDPLTGWQEGSLLCPPTRSLTSPPGWLSVSPEGEPQRWEGLGSRGWGGGDLCRQAHCQGCSLRQGMYIQNRRNKITPETGNNALRRDSAPETGTGLGAAVSGAPGPGQHWGAPCRPLAPPALTLMLLTMRARSALIGVSLILLIKPLSNNSSGAGEIPTRLRIIY